MRSLFLLILFTSHVFAQQNAKETKASMIKDEIAVNPTLTSSIIYNNITIEILSDSSAYIWPFGYYNIPWMMNDSNYMKQVAGQSPNYIPIRLTNTSTDTLFFQIPEETDHVCPLKLQVIKDNADTIAYYYTFPRRRPVLSVANVPYDWGIFKTIYFLLPGEYLIFESNKDSSCNERWGHVSELVPKKLFEPTEKKITAVRNYVIGKMIATFTRAPYSAGKPCWSGTVQSKPVKVLFTNSSSAIPKNDSVISKEAQQDITGIYECRYGSYPDLYTPILIDSDSSFSSLDFPRGINHILKLNKDGSFSVESSYYSPPAYKGEKWDGALTIIRSGIWALNKDTLILSYTKNNFKNNDSCNKVKFICKKRALVFSTINKKCNGHEPPVTEPYYKKTLNMESLKGDWTEHEAIDLIIKIHLDLLFNKASFCETAKLYSEDNASNQMCGEATWTKKNPPPKEFKKFLKSLKPGEISEPFKSSYGWHVFRLIKKEKKGITLQHILITYK